MKDLTGKKAVAFDLVDADGKQRRSEDDLGSWQLLIFHRHLG